ncbi:alpha/beta hydrolase family protein [Georgenia faecalis]|uniref:alpha/beta hydrolase family protein n=1 Tax=Georgenia faecalis TaxID=2483799 RepID=UPI000FD72500|nr:prolyl oligopeptidase family serine peptidase [Georgenia faecalis]
MRSQKAAVTLVLVLLFGLLGSIAGPAWNPQPLERTLVPAAQDVRIGGDVVTDPVGTYEVTSEVITVELDGASVDATVRGPVDAPGDRAGVVFLHGAGTATHETFFDISTALASAGVVALVPDKRMDTYTTRERDYEGMAQDYLASLEVLAGWPGVDPDRVGIYAESEGAFIAPVAAAENDAVDFVILVSAPVVTPREQAAFAVDSYLRNIGAPEQLLRAVPRLIGSEIPGGGFEYADFDPAPYQRRVTQPVLMVYGTADASMPTVQGPEQVIDDIAAAGNTAYTVRYFADANHGIRIDGELAPGFAEDVARWIQGLPETAEATPRIAGAEPEQRYRADPVARPRWYMAGDMLVVSLVSGVGLVLLGPLVWLGSRAVRRPARVPAPVGRWTTALGLGVLAVWVLFLAYLVSVASLALNYQTDPLLVRGGWLGIQVLAVATTGILVGSADRWWRSRRSGDGPSAAGTVALASVHLGALALLVLAGYWGIFPTVL